jgi:hypothetical protein
MAKRIGNPETAGHGDPNQWNTSASGRSGDVGDRARRVPVPRHQLMTKWATIAATTLRTRPVAEKAQIVWGYARRCGHWSSPAGSGR